MRQAPNPHIAAPGSSYVLNLRRRKGIFSAAENILRKNREESMMTGKTLYRSREQRMISGVCGGIGAYFNVDPTIIRLAWVLLSFFFSLGIGGLLAYIICAVIIPEEPA